MHCVVNVSCRSAWASCLAVSDCTDLTAFRTVPPASGSGGSTLEPLWKGDKTELSRFQAVFKNNNM